MLDKQEVQDVLDRFVTSVVNQSKRALTLQSKNRSGKLHKSIKGYSKASTNSFETSFEMAKPYGKFQDRGVKGVGGIKADGSAWKVKTVSRNGFGMSSPYKFGSKQPPMKAFKQDRLGRPVSDGRAFATAKTVYHQGIKSSLFFTKPFESAFSRLPQELIEAYGLDIEDFLEFTLNET